MLAAGGTGGHLFPAFALAEELGRRGIVVDLVTDERGDRYGTGFPARTVHEVPAATLAGTTRSPSAGPVVHARHAASSAAYAPARPGEARRGGRIWRLSDLPAADRRQAARHSDRPARTERGDGPRQPHAGRPRRPHRLFVREHQVRAGDGAAKSAGHRQPGARRGAAGGPHPLRNRRAATSRS